MNGNKDRSLWVGLCTLYLVTAGVFSALAPFGSWTNQMFGFGLWLDNDPGGWYVASAHELFASDQGPLFPGHPGLTLQILLHGIERAFFWVSRAPGEELTPFMARNFHRLGFLARLIMTGLHLASFYLLFVFSRKLSGSTAAARLAVLGYATSLPVLYYLSRISVEPLLILFFLASFLSLWEYRECIGSGSLSRAIGFAALAAVLAVSGLVTKFHLLAPLPLLGLLYVVTVGPAGSPPELRRRWRPRVPGVLAYLGATLVALFSYSRLLDWGEFFALWGVGGGGDESPFVIAALGEAGAILQRIGSGLVETASAEKLLPSASKSGIFLLCELPFLAIALVGMVLFRRGREGARREALWPVAFSCYTLGIFAYRSAITRDFHSFHYLFVFAAMLAVFVGVALEALAGRLPQRGRAVAAMAAVLLLHHVPIWAVIDSRIEDVRAYQQLRPFHAALERIEGTERVGVLHRQRQFDLYAIHGLSGSYSADKRASVLAGAVEALFVPVALQQQEPEQLARRFRRARVAIVVDQTEDGSPATVYDLADWTAEETSRK